MVWTFVHAQGADKGGGEDKNLHHLINLREILKSSNIHSLHQNR
ncbi:hypothetical protein SAMN05421594_0922 [Chryseobacterium oleae]|uniref:Uncharacterized protein n=1 Tax=Chryseobacterium oleae TaxID=491207 RepID=A0A1I4W562_CHROL|nr:hypothetical protein SAMN05421594_0922 [Chryseobacterium oleae]